MRKTAQTFFAALLLLSSLHSMPANAEETISEQWMEVRMNNAKIGFAYQKATKTKSGYKLIAKSVIKLQMFDVTQDISTSRTYFLDSELRPIRFSYMQKMLGHRQFFEGIVKGDKLHMTIRSSGNVREEVIPFGGNTYLADAFNFLLGKKKLEEGKKFEYKIFIEPLLATETISVEIGKLIDFEYAGKTEKVWEVISRFKSITTMSYITPDGRVLKETSPMGIVSLAVNEKQAISFSEGIMPFTNMLAYSLITPDRQIEAPEKLSSINLQISGLTKIALIPQDSRQKIGKTTKGGNETAPSYTVEIRVNRNDRDTLPKMQRPIPAKGFVEFLKPTFETQSDDPLIREQASKIVKGETDSFKAAVKINNWVYKNVEKKFIDTFSAVATLKSLEGECQSHTNLFAALAKSSGLPVRTVSGIVYSKQFNGFLYHAWPEVYVGKWIAMDPTLGQEIADPTHIKLIEGDLSKQLQLFEFIGKIGINIISVEPSA